MKLPGWGTVAGVIASWFSPAERVRRMKDEVDKLEREKNAILIHKAEVKAARRIAIIDDKLRRLNGLLRNNA